MIDPATIASGVATSLAVEHTKNALHDMSQVDPDEAKRYARRLEFWDFLEKLDQIEDHLNTFLTSQQRTLSPDEWYIITLNVAAGGEWIVPHYTKQHFLLFVAGSTPLSINFFVPGLGIYNKSVGPGWIQVDLPEHTELTSGDTDQHQIAIVFSDSARGTFL